MQSNTIHTVLCHTIRPLPHIIHKHNPLPILYHTYNKPLTPQQIKPLTKHDTIHTIYYNILYHTIRPVTHISFRCEVPTRSGSEGQYYHSLWLLSNFKWCLFNWNYNSQLWLFVSNPTCSNATSLSSRDTSAPANLLRLIMYSVDVVYIYIYIYVYMYVYIYIYMYVCIRICICMCICVWCVHIHTCVT